MHEYAAVFEILRQGVAYSEPPRGRQRCKSGQ